MELIARGISYQYKSAEESMAIEALKWQWEGQYLSSLSSLSAQMEGSGLQRVMDSVNDHYFPTGKYERAAKIDRFQKAFARLRDQGPIKIRATQ